MEVRVPLLGQAGSSAAGSTWIRLGLTLNLAGLLVSCSRPEASSGTRIAPARSSDPRVLRLAQQAIRSLDPADSESVYESLPVNQIFDGLVDIDTSLGIVPALASTWTVSRDGKVYTFRLRPGVKFHDGSTMSAQDVIFTFRRLLSPEHAQRNIACSYLSIVKGATRFARGERTDLPGVSAPDPLTVRIQLERPYASFLEVLAMDGLRVVPRSAVRKIGAEGFARAPVGTGPYRLATWDGEGLHLEANPDYFAGPPSVDRVDIQFLRPSEHDLGAKRFRSGALDVLEVPPGELDRLSREPDVRIHRYQEMSLSFLGFRSAEVPFRDVRVRQAIAHALDRRPLVGESESLRREATGILPPGITGYTPRVRTLEFDPELSRRLLREAGYPGGQGLPRIELYALSSSPATAHLAARIGADLAAVGIDLVVREVSWDELAARIDGGTAPAFLLTWVADLTDPDAFLRTLFQSGGPANFFAFRDRDTDELLKAGARETSPALRAKIYGRIEQRVLELAPVVPLYHSVGVIAMRKTVQGFEPGPLGLANVRLEKVRLGVGTSS